MTNDNEINVNNFNDLDVSTYWLERVRDAIDLASDRDTVTWLVRDGRRIAAIVPVDTAQSVVALETQVAELRAKAAERRSVLAPVGDAGPVGLIDPDCRDGKHTSCVGGPCECVCHDTGPRLPYEPGD